MAEKYELLMIPVDENEDDIELLTVSAQTDPLYQGWYVGRNESNLHEAITVIRRATERINTRLTTLIFPIEKGQALPIVKRNTDGAVSVALNGTDYLLDIDRLDQ